MAIINFGGAEGGGDGSYEASGTRSIVTSPVASGTYAYRTNPATTGTGYFGFAGFATGGAYAVLSVATLCVQFRFRVDTLPASNEERAASIRTGTSSTQCKLSINVKSDGKLAVVAGSADTLLGTSSAALSTGTWYIIRMKAPTGTGVSGQVSIYDSSGTLVEDISLSTYTNTTNAQRFRIGKDIDLFGQTVDFFYDDVALDDAAYPNILAKSENMMPDGDGAYDTFSGTTPHWQQLDELPAGTTDNLTSPGSIGSAQTCSLESASSAGIGAGDTVLAVKAWIYGRRNGTTNCDQQLRLRSGSTNSDSASLNLGTSYTDQAKIHVVDPATGSPWTVSALDSIEVGAVDASVESYRFACCRAEVLFVAAVGGAPARNDLMLLGVGA